MRQRHFQHNSRRHQQGISSIELGRRLGMTQTTAWKVKHKLKKLMMERDARKQLTGRVEIDDVYLGGERPGGKRGLQAGATPYPDRTFTGWAAPASSGAPKVELRTEIFSP
jgi:hypothetical protein